MRLKNKHDHDAPTYSKRETILVTILYLLTLTACAGSPEIEPIPCPLFPELIALDEELVNDTPPAVRAAVTENYLRLDEYARKLEVRAGCKGP